MTLMGDTKANTIKKTIASYVEAISSLLDDFCQFYRASIIDSVVDLKVKEGGASQAQILSIIAQDDTCEVALRRAEQRRQSSVLMATIHLATDYR